MGQIHEMSTFGKVDTEIEADPSGRAGNKRQEGLRYPSEPKIRPGKDTNRGKAKGGVENVTIQENQGKQRPLFDDIY